MQLDEAVDVDAKPSEVFLDALPLLQLRLAESLERQRRQV
jgi:hypothetical protein